jgi:arylsulfatase
MKNKKINLIYVIVLILFGFLSLINAKTEGEVIQSNSLTEPTNSKKKKKLNILFMMGDQHRGDCIGADGASWLKTPHLDRLANDGVLFSNAYSSVPSCLPARTGLLTGMSPWLHGNLGYNKIPSYKYELPQMFTDAGFRTHAVGKNHFSPMRNKHGYQTVQLEEAWHTKLKVKEKCDYTLWFEKNAPGKNINASGRHYTDHRAGVFPFADELHPTYWTAERAINFLKSYDGDNPWLLKVSFQRPHPPFDPPQRWLNYYKDVKPPNVNIGDWAEKKYGQKKGSMEKHTSPTSGNFAEEEIKASMQSYYAAISFVDEQIGRVLEALEKRGELENTLIIYTADHGDEMGDHYMFRKCRPYQGSVRVPMILRWPEDLQMKAKRGQKRSELVELRDVLPTFLDAANMQKPQVMDGVSMLDILREKPWRNILDLEHAKIYEKDNAWVALTDGRYKYIYFTLTGQQQLFDLKNDPHEMNDLASEGAPELIGEWRKKMIKHLEIRGEKWVKDGDLLVQKKSIYYGINHPKLKIKK